MTRANQTVRPGNEGEEFLRRLAQLNVDRSGGHRRPHKPLLMLLAIAALVRRGELELGFKEIERTLRPLLDLYAPPVKGRHQPELPYWHLQSDEVWSVSGAARLERSAKGFPKLAALRASTGGIPERYAGPLLGDEGLAKQAVRQLLEQHFEPSLHSDVLAAVGLEPEWLAGAGASARAGLVKESSPPRDPAFRDAVLAATTNAARRPASRR